jgi:hypothetical protein
MPFQQEDLNTGGNQMKKRQNRKTCRWMMSLPGAVLAALALLCVFSAFPATARAELTVMSEVVVDPTAGADWYSGRNLNERIGRPEGGLPSIVYTKNREVHIFWCADMACSSGTSELVLPDDGTGSQYGVMLSPVVYDSAGGPNFGVSLFDQTNTVGYYTYVQCSPTTCADPTEWTTEPDPPPAPMKWTQNSKLMAESGLLLKPEENDAPIILWDKQHKGFVYFDCDNGQYCDPGGSLYGETTQSIIFDARRSDTVSTVTHVMSRVNTAYDSVNDFESTDFECVPDGMGGKNCTAATVARLDVNQFDDLFDGLFGYNWLLPTMGGGIRSGAFDKNGNPAMTLKYQTDGPDANMFALLRCSDAACTNTDVTMIDAYDDYDMGSMDPHLIYRPDSGLPVMAYQLRRGASADVKIAACNTEACDDEIATTIMTPNKDGGLHFALNMESENMLALAFRNADGGLVFTRVAIWDLIDSNDFETGWGIYTDGGNDCHLIDSPLAHSGLATVRIRDNSGVGSSFYSGPTDLSAYTQIAVSFWYRVESFEGSERFVVEFNDGL